MSTPTIQVVSDDTLDLEAARRKIVRLREEYDALVRREATRIETLRAEVRAAWRAARGAQGQSESFRIIERLVDRVGYDRTENNPPLY